MSLHLPKHADTPPPSPLSLPQIHASLLAHAERTAPPDVVARVRAAVAAGGVDGHRALLTALIDAEHAAGRGGGDGGVAAMAAAVAKGGGARTPPLTWGCRRRAMGGAAKGRVAAHGEL